MTNRKAKRLLSEADDWVLITSKRKGDETNMMLTYNKEEAWEILLNLSIEKYHIRETLRNIIKFTDEYLEDKPDSPESE